MTRRTRSLLMCGSAALALATTPANRVPARAATRQVVTLSGPRVSIVTAARTVVTFEAKGDIRGLLTLTLIREAGKAPLTGEWALVSGYMGDLLNGGAELPASRGDGESDVEERPAFYDRGTLHGPVAGGVLGFDGNGQLDTLESVGLEIQGGNLEFAGASGSGSVSASNMQDVSYGAGTVVLALEVKE
jgi:hypothetical protein